MSNQENITKNLNSNSKEKTSKKYGLTLSIKLVLINLGIAVSVNVGMFILLWIIRSSAGLYNIANTEALDRWLSLVSFITTGISAVLFGIIIHLLVVRRIKKLNDSAKKIASGDFDATVHEGGGDELEELAVSFNTMTAELKANEYLGKEFIRNISHEYKTPLSVIKAYAEWIENEADESSIDKASLKEYASIIMQETDRMATLSKSMLQLSLLDSTTIIKKEDVFCPANQINSILRIMQVKWQDKNIEFDLDLSEFSITSNEQLLYQVWQNLISNAIKFSENGGKIKMVLRQVDDKLCFEIADTGIGMNESDQQKLFTQFFMADKSRNSEGSGLGLAITKRIVDKLGGAIVVNSASGRGTAFGVRI